MGLPNEQSYSVITVGADQIVRDNVTGLIWQRATASGLFDWSSASAHCNDLDFAGQTDWRLPEMIEMVSILAFGHVGPAIDSVTFPNALPTQPGAHVFWTATPSSSFTSMRPWSVDFGFGQTYNFDTTTTPYLVRCVRGTVGGGAPVCRFTTTGNTVYDPGTRLTWQRLVAPGTYTWAQALAYCPTVSDDGGNWRLPSIAELASLVDNTRYNPSIDVSTFSGTNDATWSASPLSGSSGSAWNIRFYLGELDISLPVTSVAQVRCVR
jgi:hypothetical protein